MSLEDLRADIKRASQGVECLECSPTVANYLRETLWAFLDGLIDHVAEMADDIGEIDDAVVELVNHEEDYLQPDTAAVFAGLVVAGHALAAELKRVTTESSDAVTAQRAKKAIEEHEKVCQQALELLGDITEVPTEEAQAEPEGTAP